MFEKSSLVFKPLSLEYYIMSLDNYLREHIVSLVYKTAIILNLKARKWHS
jgi:hypothetical protein